MSKFISICIKKVQFMFFFSSPESVIKRFEQRDRAVDSRGVAEYLRALVVTNAIAEYLPDEESGKPSSLPILVITLNYSCSCACFFSLLLVCISECLVLHFSLLEVERRGARRLVLYLFVDSSLFKSKFVLFCFPQASS